MFKVQVIGNLGADAEVKEFQGRKFVSFKVAHTDVRTSEDGTRTESTVWIGCALNGDGGKLLQFLKRGVKVFVSGNASLRVYSSKKVRGFVAGCDIHVESVELCGGSNDEVPRQLAAEDGTIHDVTKLYWCPDTEVHNTTLLSSRGDAYSVDKNGFILPYDEGTSEQSEQTGSENDL